MSKYLVRRVLIAIPVLAGISLVLFTILAMAPGDPFEELATNPNVPPEVRANLRAKFGLDDPLPVRYVRWFSSMVRGDWGFSFVSRVNVDTLIMQRLATTFAFIGFSLPTFFTGLLFILLFSIYLDWLPFIYRADIDAKGWAWAWALFKQAIMPISVLGLATGATWTRFVRAAVLDVVRLDFVN